MNNPISTIAYNTFRGFSRDRIFYSTILFAIFFLFFSYLLATLTIVESRKILLDFGFAAISLSGILIAIFIGLNGVAKEIQNKTIYTILSKPISRSKYILGKYLGSAAVVIIVHLIMGATLVLVVAAVDEGLPQGLAACFFLMTLESLLLLAVAIFFSVTVSSSFLASCLTIGFFLIGRSSHSLQVVAAKSSNGIKLVLKIFYDIFPSLQRFDIREIVAYGKPFPHEMLQISGVYFLAYCILFLALASYFFADSDLP